MKLINKDLRLKIVKMITNANEGHIPSSLSIVDIINFLYQKKLKQSFNKKDKDYFILSKGHGCAALYVVLNKFKLLTNEELKKYGKAGSILGGHPDSTKIRNVEASTGSLGHGFPTATGIALGLKIKKKKQKVYCLIGDGECHEGSIWESASICANLKLDNIICILDWNKSAQQLMKIENLEKKWKSFGWKTVIANGHSNKSLDQSFKKINKNDGVPKIVICNTIKGKGISFMQGHGVWHHKIPNSQEFEEIKKELK